MSVVYSIVEHFHSDGTQNKALIYSQGALWYQLSMLGALMLQKNARIFDLQLTIGEEHYSFSGEKVNDAYQNIVEALDVAEGGIEMKLDYEITWTGGSGTIVEEILTMPIGEIISTSDAEEREGVYFSHWRTADCGEGAGNTFAYGWREGVFCDGEIPEKEVSALPDGDWYARDTIMIMDVDPMPKEETEIAESACRALMKYNDDPCELFSNEEGLYYPMNWAHVHNMDELADMVRLCRILFRHPDYEECLKDWNFEMYGNLGDYVSVAKIHVGENGDISVLLRSL